MNISERKQIKEYLLEYMKIINPSFSFVGKQNLFECPKCKETTCNFYPVNKKSKLHCMNRECKLTGDIFDIVRITNNSFEDSTDQKIGDYLKFKFKIKIVDEIGDLLTRYEQARFAMIPIAGNKQPPAGFKWRDQYSKDRNVWENWLERGWGLGLVLGEISGVDCIDIDSDETQKKINNIMGETLEQTTKRGKHYLYNTIPDIKKTLNKVMRDAGYELEYRTDGAYIVVAPTSCEGETRLWNNKKIIDMPLELKNLLLKYYKEDINEMSVDDQIQRAIDQERIIVADLSGKRNTTFLQTAGIFSKWMPRDTAMKTLDWLSKNWADKEIPRKELYAMMEQVKRYRTYDKEVLAKTILERLNVIKQSTAYQLACCLKFEQKDVEDVLKYLEDQNKIISVGNQRFEIIEKVEWTTETNDLSVPITFKMPFFDDIAYFDQGNMIIIGGVTGTGKTHLVGNFIKKLVDQGIMPYLINTEAGSKIGKITNRLGVPDNSFFVPKVKDRDYVKHPTDIELQDNAVTIIDWLKAKDGDFAKTDQTYEHLHNQLKKHGGILIIMTQLRKTNSEFFAPDLVQFYGSLVAKYLFGNNGKDSINTSFKIEKIRDSKSGQQYMVLPSKFDNNTGLVNLI